LGIYSDKSRDRGLYSDKSISKKPPYPILLVSHTLNRQFIEKGEQGKDSKVE